MKSKEVTYFNISRKNMYLIFANMKRRKFILFAVFLILNLWVVGQRKVSISSQQVVYNDQTDESILKEAKGAFGVSVSSTNVSCFGDCDGTITVTLSGTPTYPVQIRLTLPPDVGGGNVFFNNLQATDFPFTISNLCGSSAPYSIRVRDFDNSIVSVGNIYILAPAEMSIEEGDYDVFNESCAGKCDGGVSIYFVSNAQGNTYYQWSSLETTADITNKCAGTYTVTVTDDMGCTQDFSFDITAPPLLQVDSLVFGPVFCNGGTGSITVYASGGNPPYAYDIGSGYQVGNVFNGLVAGTYTVTIIDGNSCTAVSAPATLTENPAIVLSETHVDVGCFGTFTGSINLTVNGGTSPYSYSWQGPNGFTSSSEDINNIEAGNYSVTVTDNYSCTSTLSVTISSAAALNISESHTNVTCNGGTDGSITLTVSGGTAPYAYNWTGPSCPCSGSSLTNLSAGTYDVTITDNAGCSSTLSINITEPSAIVVVGSLTNVECFGQCTGAINITVNGGIPPYTYNWTGPSSFSSNSEDLTNLCAGTYWVTIKDANNCTRVRSFQVLSPPDITITAFTQNPSCSGQCNGLINLNVNGGTPPFTYAWNSGQTSQNLSNLCSGSYTVTVTDSKLCTKSQTFVLTDPAGMTLSETHVDVTCHGFNNGSIDLTVAGTYTNPLTYNWTGPNSYTSTNQDINSLFAGTYNVTVTDGSSCSKTLSVIINEQSNIVIDAAIVNVSCNGSSDASINITSSGGVAPYSYSWTGPGSFTSTNEDLLGIGVGTYNLTVTDALGCQKDTSFEITQPYPIVVTHVQQNVSCFGLSNGSIDLTVSDGNPPYSYSWTGPSCPCGNNQDLTNLLPGTYNVTITDAVLCTQTYSVTITQPSILSASETHTNVSCFGGNNGSITLSVSGGTTPYTYNWTGPSCPCSGNSLTNLTAGTYDCTITDANGCSTTQSITLTQPAAALSALETHTNVTCFGGNDGSITLTISGGTLPYSYNWTGPSCPCSGSSLTNLTAGIYDVTVTDANSCTTTLTITITEPSVINLSETHSSPLCFGQCTGTIDLTVNGGVAPYAYLWQGPSGYTNNIEDLMNLCAGTYNVTVTDANLCTKTLSINITQPTQLIADITSQTNMSCGGGCSASATVTPSGGTPNYSYLWSNGETSPTAIALCVGWNYVTVTDVNGCTAVDSTEILAPPPLSAVISDSTMSCGGAPTGVLGNSIYVPDGPSCPQQCYQTTVDIDAFSPSATLQNASQLESICVNMEHSFAGDLSFKIICPNNQSVVLDSYDMSGGSYLGIANEMDCGACISNPPGCAQGTGWTYCWSEIYPQQGLLNVLDAGSSPIPPTDVSNNLNYLMPQNPLSGLVGCPLNGTWKMEICDNWAIDDGWVFWWQLNFAPSLYPSQYCNGTATVAPSGGQAPYTYMWSNGETTQTITNLCSGNYCVTVTDANNCTATTCVTIIDINLTIDSISKTNASCSGVCNGTATVNTTNGFAPITYLWSNTQTTQTITNLCAGTYSVTVSEANGCTAVDSVVISNGLSLQSTVNVTNTISCHGDCTAGAVVLMTNGLAPYTYNWSPNSGDTGPIISNMCEGTYNVTITDNNGCTTTNSVTFSAPPSLVIDSVQIQNEQPCNASNNGSITIYVSGGTPPYQYNIGSGNQASNQFTNLQAGNYTPTITDANGCQLVGNMLTITEPPVLSIDNITSSDVTPCFGSANGTITITVSGGVPPYQYNIGSGNQASNLFNGLSGGTYTVTVTDNLGCTIVSNAVTIIEPTLLTLDLVSQTDVACNGAATGTLVVTGNGGVPAYSYNWTGPSCPCSGNSLSNLLGGLYFATVTDNLGCTATNVFEIKDTSNLKIDTLVLQNPLCFNQNNGSITVGGSGGQPPYSYLWDSGLPSQPNQTNLTAGTYNVTVYDANNCSRSASITLINPQPIQDSITIDQPIVCNGQCNAVVTVHPYNGVGTYTYQWDDLASSTTATVSNLCEGTYHVTIYDANLCTKVDSIIISQPSPILNTITQTQAILCYGQCTAQVNSSVSGGVAPYSYSWSSGTPAMNNDNNVCAGWLFVTVTDANGCSKVDSINISQPDSIQITFNNVTNVNCHGDCSGQATTQVSGGTPGYSYQWDASAGNQTTQTATLLCAGFHFVTVTDANSCTNSNFVQISDTSNLSINILSQQSPLCFGGNDGQINVTGTGGYPPYNYIWEDNSTGPVHSNLTAGNYFVTVTDDSLCSASLLIPLVEPPQLLDSITIDNSITCYGSCDAVVTVHPYGGTPNYTVQWNIGSNANTIFGLCQGTFNVTITDANGCIRMDSVTINQPDEIVNTININQSINCYNSCNGEVQVSSIGGTGAITYAWSNGESGNIAHNLCAGWIWVTATDVNGCIKIDSIELTQPDSIQLMITSTNVACSNHCTGTAFVLVMGGLPPYSYQWDANAGNATTPIVNNLCAGSYMVTVSDALGCTSMSNAIILDTSNLSIDTLLLQNPLCNGLCNGAITVSGTGGYPPYTYSWDHGLPSLPNQTNLCAGIYNITITDDSTCQHWTSIELLNPPVLQDSVQILQTILCNSDCNGSVAVFPYGGTSPYSFSWDDPLLSGNDTLQWLCAGIYHVTITDANGCLNFDSVQLANPPVLLASTSIIQPISCYNQCDGKADVTIQGGMPPYTILWSNGDILQQADSLCAGWVYVTVTDVNLCQVVDSIQFIQPDSITISFITTAASCGGNNGTATATVVGGTPPYTYQWDANAHNQTTDIADSLSVNIYFITVTDGNGCSAVANVAIIDTSNLTLNITDVHNITCAGSCDGSATASVTGGYPAYTYLWSTIPPQTDSVAINLCVGTYTVTVVDDSLCSRVGMIEITDVDILQVHDSIVPISCSGLCDASIILIPSGGTPPYVTYAWSIPGETDSIASGLCSGTYYYTVTDANNCVVSDSVTITDPGAMSVSLDILHAILCHNDCNGSIGVSVIGALGPYTYQWSNGSTDSVLVDLCAGVYDVTVTGIGGCSSTSSITLINPDSLQVTFTNIIQVNCGGDCSGRVTALVSGGTSPYTYLWDANAGNATTPTIDSLCANLYFITITDNSGCSLTSMFEVTDTSHLELHILDSSMVSCYGRCDGWAMAQASNGFAPYSYAWNTTPPQFDGHAVDLCAGMYIVTVTDDSLCSRVRAITITQPDSLYIKIIDSLLIQCNGSCTGAITVSNIGGTSPYVFQWNTLATDTTITGLCAGLYTATLTDAHNCMDSIHYFVTEPTAIDDSTNVITSLCAQGSNDGSVTLIVNGGNPPYQIQWSTGDTIAQLDSLASGTYYYTITDANGCIKQDSVLVSPMIVVHATAKSDTTICYGDSVQIFGFGGAVYFWTPGTGLSDSTLFNPIARPTVTTTYYFNVFDSICFDVDSVTIGVYPQITVDAGVDQTILYDHSTTLNGTCSDPNATFLWIPATGLEDSSSAITIAHPLQTTTYYLLATNANGCTVMDSVTITIIPKIRIPSGFTPNGDGMNDEWVIDLIELFPNCEVYIYNRWGEKLYYSKGYPASERWNGKYNGKDLPSGTYYYIINLHDEAYPDPITGPITIMR